MTLSRGERLGPYEILDAIGAGGMGEVYRARDTKLHRDVALKVLPDLFANDPDRLARFEREAHVLAALNHPHIAQIYGIEGRALVMEFVEGEDLAQRLTRGPIPLDEALAIARQIAEALEAAHEQGIIHRDLKPANIKVRPDGMVKVLDFGLAKAMDAGGASSANAMNSPTLTSRATQLGVILGTAAYMSPEQAAGKVADRRSDLWSFGVVVFEMLTGCFVFKGETVSHVLASVLKDDPDWTELPANTPLAVRRLLRRCLVKDPKRRLADAADARLEIDDATSEPVVVGPVSGGGRTLGASKAWMVATAALSLVALTSVAFLWMRGSAATPPAPVARVTLPMSSDDSLRLGAGVAISPDGQTVAFVARSPETSRLYIRRLDDRESRGIPGTEGATFPFFSPDGNWIGFSTLGSLKKVPLRTGSPQVVCKAVRRIMSGHWGRDGQITFTTWPDVSLMRVPAEGGTAETLIRSGEGSGVWYLWPERLPESAAVLFTVWRQGQTSIVAFVPGEKEPRLITKSGAYPRYLSTGQMVYLSEGHLVAVPFDVQRLAPRGGATVVIDDVMEYQFNAAYDVSASGTLLYVPTLSALNTLVWKDRRGATTPIGLSPRRYSDMALSPDGKHLSATVQEGPVRNVWTGSVEREPMTRLTFGNDDLSGVWTHDGRRLFVNSGQDGRYNIYWIPTDGSGKAERLTNSPDPQAATSLSPDGEVLLFNDVDDTGVNIWQLLPGRTGAQPVLKSRANEFAAAFSPDGRWMAYQSDESGHSEVYVRAYPGLGRKVQISAAGGSSPRWNRNGRELFYQTSSAIMAVAILDPQNLRVGAPVRLFPYAGGPYDVSPDGQRFLTMEQGATARSLSPLHLVQNWFEELKVRVPTK